MSASTVGLFLRHLALSQEVSRLGTASDRDLLAAYDPERGQAAFTELVRRYGPMVLRTCRRVLGHGPDAEDAFQATFVLLARQAGQLSREAKAPLSLGGWLHRVAHRTAVNVLSQSARRRAREQQTRVMNQPNADPVAEATWNEVRPILDAELEALPDESRRLLVACYLQGKTHAEAAFELDLPLGSVARRLDKARSLMAARLTRRGITVSATLLAVLLGETGKGAEVPAVLLVHTVEAARRFTEQAAGSISENVFRLVRGGLAQMTTNGSTYMSVALVGCMALLGAGLIVSQTLKAWPEPTPSSGEPVTATAPEPSATRQEKQKATDRFSDPLPSGTLARMGTVCLRHATGLFWMSFTEDGKGMVTAGVWNPARLWDVASVWDAASGEQQRQLRADGDHFFCSGIASITSTISSDGNTLASASWQRNFEAWKGEIQYRLWDRSSGRELRRWSQDLNNFAPRWFVFSPDGKSVACARYDKSPPYRVHLRDAATGKERARVVGSYAAFSPDIKLLATAPEYDSAGPFFTLWDAATGNEICSVSSLPEGYRLQRLLFSPDGRMLATASSCNRSNMEPSGIHLWPLFRDDPASEGRHPPVERSEQDSDVRRSRVRVGSPRVLAARGLPFVDIYRPSGFNAWAFSPDGRTLALCGEGGTVRLVETVSGKERSRFTGHGGDVTALAFAPDGRRLASGSRDTTVLVWDVTGRLHQGQLRRTQLSTKQLQRYWADLAGADAGRAGSAIWALASDPSRSVPFLTEQLRTAAEEVKKRLVGVPQLIRDLDDDAFAVRENAKTELARLGEAAEPALLRALAKSPSPELRRSLKQLLETVEAHRRVPVDASLRCLRAVETLEQIADGESRSTLKALASDAPMDSAVALEAPRRAGALTATLKGKGGASTPILSRQRADAPTRRSFITFFSEATMPIQKTNVTRAGFTLIELLVVIAIIAVLIALLLPAVQRVRESANRAKCLNNLKQLALAALMYNDTYQTFPLQGTISASPPGCGSAYIALLPFLEQGNLYRQIYNGAVANNTFLGDTYATTSPGVLCATPLTLLACPSDQLPSPPTTYNPLTQAYVGVTSYMGNIGDSYLGLNGIFLLPPPYSTVSILCITDGTSNTFLFGERYNYDIIWNELSNAAPSFNGVSFSALFSPWGTYGYGLGPFGSGNYPLNYTISQQNPPWDPSNPYNINLYARSVAFGSGHSQGANFAFCDGSVRFISNTINSAATLASNRSAGW